MTAKNNRALTASERRLLEKTMKSSKKTQAAFAEDLGCSQQMVCKLINGKIGVSVNMAVRLELATAGLFRARQFFPDLFPAEKGRTAA